MPNPSRPRSRLSMSDIASLYADASVAGNVALQAVCLIATCGPVHLLEEFELSVWPLEVIEVARGMDMDGASAYARLVCQGTNA